MKLNLTLGSWLLFGLSVVLWLLLTLFESMLVGMSLVVERLIAFLLLVLPAAIGVVLGTISLARREKRAWLAIAGILLNTLFGFFQLMVILFAG